MQHTGRWPRLALLLLAVLLVHGALLREWTLATRNTAPPARAAQVRVLPAVRPEAAPQPVASVAPMATPNPQRRTAVIGDPPVRHPASQIAAALAGPTPPVATPSGPSAAERPANAAAAAADLPLYRTRLPPAFALAYDLRRGASAGTAELQWRPEGDRYEARFESRLAGRPATVWQSSGHFDEGGIAPLRHTNQRRGRGTQAANFQRDAGLVTFSGPQIEFALPAGAQDRVSWLIQLAAIGAAEPALMTPGTTISLFVVGARGSADVWTFTAMDGEVLDLPAGATPTVRLLREPARAWDSRVEVWLAPALGFIPVRARLVNGRDADALELTLREVSPGP